MCIRDSALPTCILFQIRIQTDLLCRNRQQIMSFLETITRFILVILNVFYRYIIPVSYTHLNPDRAKDKINFLLMVVILVYNSCTICLYEAQR